MLYYLYQSSLCVNDFPHSIRRNTEHRQTSNKPTKYFSPYRISVFLISDTFLWIFDQTEQEYPLIENTGNCKQDCFQWGIRGGGFRYNFMLIYSNIELDGVRQTMDRQSGKIIKWEHQDTLQPIGLNITGFKVCEFTATRYISHVFARYSVFYQ